MNRGKLLDIYGVIINLKTLVKMENVSEIFIWVY